METRECTKCKQCLEFPKNFFKDKKGKGGYKSCCKKCDQSIKRKPKNKEANKKYRTGENYAKYRAMDNAYKRKYLSHLRKNSDKYRAYKAEKDKAYRQTPSGRASMARNKSKRKSGDPGKLTGKQWLSVLKKFENRCAYCGTSDACLTMDHFIPISKGGKTIIENIVPACISCNSSKQNKPAEEWCDKEVYSKVLCVMKTIA